MLTVDECVITFDTAEMHCWLHHPVSVLPLAFMCMSKGIAQFSVQILLLQTLYLLCFDAILDIVQQAFKPEKEHLMIF